MPFMMIGAQEVTDEGAKILGDAMGGNGGHKYSACATESTDDVSKKGDPGKGEDGEGDENRYSDAERYNKTFALCIVMFGMGTMHAIIGPTLLDLAYGLSISLSEVSLVFVGQAVGFILGVAIGGVTMDLVNHWLFMGLIIIVAAFLTIAVPHWESLKLLVLASVLRGSCIRALELASNVELLDIWGKESSSPMQQLHFTVAVGCGVVPLLVKPFVGKELNHTAQSYVKDESGNNYSKRQLTYESSNYTHSLTNPDQHSLSAMDDGTAHVDLEGSRIEWAYFIVGLINLTIGVYLLTIFCCYPRKQAKSQLEPIIEGDTPEERAKDLTFKIHFISVGVLLLAVYFGVLLAFDGYLVTFAVISDLHMNFDEATTLAATFWLVFAFGRLMAVFYSLFISDFVIMQIDMVLLLISSIPLAFAASHDVTAFYICNILYAMSFASLGPAALSYTSKFITISGKIGAIYMIGGSTGEILLPFFIAYMMDHYDPMWLMYVVTSCTVLMLPLAILKFYLAHQRGEKRS